MWSTGTGWESTRRRGGCPECGDSALLSALRRLAEELGLEPEKTVVVSGTGYLSRLPHVMNSYGFHGLEGRAFPVACGIRIRRPDLHLFVVTTEAACTTVGAAHWLNTIRYNMDLTILLPDARAELPPLDTLAVTLGVANASFVAQTVAWDAEHLYETLRAAYAHPATAFVRVLQRCRHGAGEPAVEERPALRLLVHENGIRVGEGALGQFAEPLLHDPSDLGAARELAGRRDASPVGLLYRNAEAARYDLATARGSGKSPAERLAATEDWLGRFAV